MIVRWNKKKKNNDNITFVYIMMYNNDINDDKKKNGFSQNYLDDGLSWWQLHFADLISINKCCTVIY